MKLLRKRGSKMDINITPQQKVIDYFTKKESRWGYSLFLKGIKHFGYYPESKEKLSMAEAQRLMVEKLHEKLDLETNSLLLDAGCGEGEVATYLANKYQFRVRGVDLLNFSIEKAIQKRNHLRLKDKVEFHVMDYANLDFSEEIFDGVYTMETLVHASDHRHALKEFHRVLKPNGRLVLFEYSMCPPDNFPPRLRKIAEMVIEESGMHSLPYFLHGKFPEILGSLGFTDISVENITPRIMPMLRKFNFIAWLPYQLIKLLRLERKFVNATAAVEGYKNLAGNDYCRYNIVVARKTEQRNK